MGLPSHTYAFFATCPRYTEDLLLNELQDLGAGQPTEGRAGVSFVGPLALGYKVCLWSRVASRVLLQLRTFPLKSVDTLYENVRDVPWEDHLRPDGTLAVEATSSVSQGPLATTNTHFVEQRVKDAVVDRLRARTGKRPSVDLIRPQVRLNLHLAPTGATLSLDLSGNGLHRRGYRLEGGEAPLRENLAVALLLRSGWPQLAARGASLLDPMCGSGTLLVEAALVAADIAPGLLRNYFGFFGWLGFEPNTWEPLLAEARTRRQEGLAHLPRIYGFDADARALRNARGNIYRAGLGGRIALEQRDLSHLAPPSGPAGLLITNPPYGKRLGQTEELIAVYETLGERLRNLFTGWEAVVFTGNPDLTPYLNLRAHHVNTFQNGPLPCKLLRFALAPEQYRRPEPAQPVPEQPKLQRSEPASHERGHSRLAISARSAGIEMFANRVQKNRKHLQHWAAREGITCYRLYDADLPEYAVAIDLYEQWVHVQEYAAPRTVDPVKARQRLHDILGTLPELLQVAPENIILKVRHRQRGNNQYQKLANHGQLMEVGEGGLCFLVNLTDYVDTGLFLDHRLTRALLRQLAPGRRFLNLFGYTGTATVYAAAGGAASTTTVDLSAHYLEWARRNLERNHLASPNHQLVQADCVEWLAHSASEKTSGGTYDLIFLDPPTFSNSKSMRHELDVQRDHIALIRSAMSLLSPQGILIFSTNFRRFALADELRTSYEIRDISRQTLPPDFKRSLRVHQCFRITHKSGTGEPREIQSAQIQRS